MDEEELNTPNWVPRSLLFGITLFIIGLIIDDLFTVVSGLSLIIIGVVVATGEKIIQKMDYRPKGL